ncbi:7SK snRNA methylphosphate capping enzyme-like [Myxocyprinus asiaticus]|uniref:7SK snRNA methylphosphate capping enzyme-like n=1 Tax=Myxocyprinus asiaticus TaxID=70543 RepID=UPI00222294EF|nr:7SK snRNA methylphosphate capping enzyme-like [Myxocyprinus asiaticus]
MLTAMSVQSEPTGNSGAGMHTHPDSTLQMPCPATIQDVVTTNTVLTELSGNHVTPQDGVGNAAAPTAEGPAQIKNGLQLRSETQQKLSKRRFSMNVGFKHPSLCKRRRRVNSECDPVLPTNFLMGGNIFDPLNLNSLMDEEVNQALNAETPKSSPLPAKNRDPVEILIPKDITDPLNLNSNSRKAVASMLIMPVKKRKHRYRHHGAATGGVAGQLDLSDVEKSKEGSVSGPLFPRVSSSVSAQGVPAEGAEPLAPQAVEEWPRPYELTTSINCRDEVVTLILPKRWSHPSSSSSATQPQHKAVSSASSAQPSKHRKRRRTNSRSERLSITPTLPTKHPNSEKAHSQMFHTPTVGGASGGLPSGAQRITQHQRRPQRKFQYGDYSHYYSYRTPALSVDPRLAVFRPEWFRGKKVLDVGCNTGRITLAIARHWSPNHILGVDIDDALVRTARQNLRHFLSELCGQQSDGTQPGESARQTEDAAVAGEGSEVRGRGELGLTPLMHLQLEWVQGLSRFPLSFTRCRGPIATPPIMPHVPGLFPSNVSFLKGNYVPDSDAAVMSQCEEYDVIMCLSLTKWVHLNFGDAGVQRLFQRIYRHLLPGGVLILEPQPWSSYARRKRLTEVTHRNYNSIRLKPDQFSSFLTADVGFSSYELIATPRSCPTGFQRPIYLFHKGPASNRK